MIDIWLKKGREKAVQQRHPWVFSGSVERIEGEAGNGAEARVLSSTGAFLARGFYSSTSQICCRLFRWQDAPLDREFFAGCLQRAAARRRRFFGTPLAAYRLVNSEGDGLPGLIIDRYGEVLVMQCNHAGIERLKPLLVELLVGLFEPAAVFERSEGGARKEEGLENSTGWLYGEQPDQVIVIEEAGLRFKVDLQRGQKTGFYLDQRDNRRLVRQLAADKSVLDAFCYTGGFALNALAGGARQVVCVDASKFALRLVQENEALNELNGENVEIVNANVFQYLRTTEQKFDFIILDPPPLARHRRDVKKAARAYKDVNLQAMKRLQPGGLLLTCNCSQHVTPDLFQKIVFAAATDASVDARIVGESAHPADHPISLYHPEGRYLHAFLVEVES